MPLSTGQMLNNRYRIVKLLGQGGFGAVYKAWDVNLDTPRAVKENLETSPEAQRQFKREAQILDKLSHPNLPKVIDHFSVAGQGQYLVMEYIEGEDLGARLTQAGGALPEGQALQWVSQVCEALNCLHNQQPPVIHRDIKPANIKITPQGKAMLVDFGIAKVYDPTIATTVGARAVTPGYSPQEQYGKGATDARTDVYALGATLYHLLTGQTPVESIERTLGIALTPPRQLNPTITVGVERAILKAMAPLPHERFPTIAAFQQALAAPATAPVVAAPGQPVAQTTPYLSQTAAGAPGMHPGAAPPASRPSAGTIALPANLPWVWIAAGIGVLVIGALAAGGLIRALENWRESLAVITFAAETQTRLTQMAANSVPATTPPPPATVPLTTTDSPPPTDTPPPTASPTPTGLASTITDSKGVVMNLVPAGSFLMGSENGDSDEKPVHEVYLDAFYIDIYEVTNEKYAACVSAGACTRPGETKSYTRSSYYGNAQYAQYPVIYVSWNDAVKYCEWRGGRLPTEAEWEKAARGGLQGKKYPWGDEDPVCTKGAVNEAQFGSCSPNDTIQVGSFAPNDYGLYDMAGNVWEWVQDWYSENYYSSQSTWNNPTGPSSGQYKVLRGGGWGTSPDGLRSAYRSYSAPDNRDNIRGFRCGVSAPGK